MRDSSLLKTANDESFSIEALVVTMEFLIVPCPLTFFNNSAWASDLIDILFLQNVIFASGMTDKRGLLLSFVFSSGDLLSFILGSTASSSVTEYTSEIWIKSLWELTIASGWAIDIPSAL